MERGPSGIVGIVLAAGDARRFGGPKQLADFRGKPLLEHALAGIEGAGLDRVIVVLGANADRVRSKVPLHGAEPVVCEAWGEGMARSLQAGVEAAGEIEAAVVVLGDQPLLSREAVARVLSARDPAMIAVGATYGGKPGHPVLLERPALDRLGELRGDEGARQLLAGAEWRDVACDGLGSALDVDTPEDLAALEAGSRHHTG